MDHRFGNHFRFAEAAENVQHIGYVFRGHQRVRRDGGHAGVHQRGGIGHCANNFAVMAQRARQLVKRHACGNRHDQRLFIQAGGDIAQHFDHDVRLDGAKDDIGDLGHFLRAFGGVNPVLIAQRGDLVR